MIRPSSGTVRLSALLVLLLTAGFAVTSVVSFNTSRDSIRSGIVLQELPLTADSIYSEIQKDLIRPVFVSSMMANDTFLRHWVLAGETDVPRLTQYLQDIQSRFDAVTAFFVSDVTHRYYYPGGILKTVTPTEPRDEWFWRVKRMPESYETNVDLDLAHNDDLTIFINYRVFDFGGRFLGAAGIGLTVATVKDFVRHYESRYNRRVFFVDGRGKVTLSADKARPSGMDLAGTGALPWARAQAATTESVVSLDYHQGNSHYLASVRYLPELKWFLVVEKDEGPAMAGIESILWFNLALCLGVALVVVAVFGFTTGGYHRRLERLAWTDPLTGLANRQALEVRLEGEVHRARKAGYPLVLGVVDADHFKQVNDAHGHAAGDETLRNLATLLRAGIRTDDVAGRWGGEEFLVLLHHCGLEDGLGRFQGLLNRVDAGPWARPETSVTVSIGVAALEPDESLERWIQRADDALYQAKAAGRHRVSGNPAV